jgi:hypothetical protein
MILYHFTCRQYLPSILEHGLYRGEVPLSATEVLNAVNLTTASTPHGHGLSTESRLLTDEERRHFEQADGVPVPAGARFEEKTAVRIKVKIASADRALVRWSTFARKRMAPEWRAALEDGRRPDTWWLYFGTIPPEEFMAVDLRQGDT